MPIFPQSINPCIQIHSSFWSWKKSATAEYVDHKIMIQIKLVKYRIFLHSCDGSLTLVNKLESCTNVLGYICIRGTLFKSYIPNPSPRHATNEVRRVYPEFSQVSTV